MEGGQETEPRTGTGKEAQPGGASLPTRQSRRLLEVTAVVAIWMAIGALINDGGSGTASGSTLNWYLLIGVPLVAAFQLWVRRRPLIELWIRDGGRGIFKPMLFRILFAAAVIFPIYVVIKSLADSLPASFVIYGLVSIVGAGGFAYAYMHFNTRTFKYLALCLATAGAIGVIPEIIHDFTAGASHPLATSASGDFWVFWLSFLTYLPSLYVMEEVAFRGCFDSHIHQEGDRHGIWTAIYVSALWGAWHGPIIGWEDVPLLVVSMGIIGTFLSIFWRKSGNLGVSATTHAVIDSVRNAAGLAP
jgi:membrane protease YdiL (CAAX protease family)